MATQDAGSGRGRRYSLGQAHDNKLDRQARRQVSCQYDNEAATSFDVMTWTQVCEGGGRPQREGTACSHRPNLYSVHLLQPAGQ